MSAPSDHSHDATPGAGHSFEEEVRHAQEHAKENNWFFGVFFVLMLLAVLSYEFKGTNPWFIGGLALLRCGWIGFFMFVLFRRFGYIFTSFIFTLIFFIGMVYLSLWDSTMPKVGDPITIKSDLPTEHKP